MATATRQRPRLVKDDEPKKSPPLVIQLPPDVFARAWVNLRTIAAASKSKAWWLEYFDDEGCWLTTTGGPATAAAWVPTDPAFIDQVPLLMVEPDHVVCFADPDGRINNLCERVLKQYGSKDSLAPGLDEYLSWRPGIKVDGKQMTLAGMEAPTISVWSNGERHEAIGLEMPPPQWRPILRTFEHVARDSIQVTADMVKLMGSFKGMRPATLEFGSGSNARFRLTADTGDWPTILGVVDVGRRKDVDPVAETPVANDETGDLPPLVQETYDVDTKEWSVNDDWDTEP